VRFDVLETGNWELATGQEQTMYPADLKYTKDHEWVRLAGAEARVGITDYAQKQLGDVVFLELPEVGRAIKKGEVFGTIESVKAVSELYAPVSGEVTQVNSALTQKPEAVNKDPHGSWMIALQVADPGETSDLYDATKYGELTR
jgi:glycine cleavage system H protein